ncbi:MAG: DNA alkylation repair protein [Treponema sp.]|nr:DNA alkylation repair protein [Treponema sp.]
MEIKEIKDELYRLAGAEKAAESGADGSSKYADFSKSLNPTSLPMLGVRLPELRKLAKKIAKNDYKKFLGQNPMDSFEMETLQAMVIGYAKDDLSEILACAADFIPKIHDWSVNDSFCQTFKICEKPDCQKECWDFFMKYANSKREFEVRVVAVMLMSHYLNDEYIDRVIQVLNNVYTGDTPDKSDYYYAKMGVAWAVATVAAKYPEKCLAYMKSPDNHLDGWTYNKSIQKMCESFRVSEELKEEMKKLRK